MSSLHYTREQLTLLEMRPLIEEGAIPMTRELMIRLIDSTDIHISPFSRPFFELWDEYEAYTALWVTVATPAWLEILADVMLDPPPLSPDLQEEFDVNLGAFFGKIVNRFPNAAREILHQGASTLAGRERMVRVLFAGDELDLDDWIDTP